MLETGSWRTPDHAPVFRIDSTAITELAIQPESVQLSLDGMDPKDVGVELAASHITGVEIVGQYVTTTADGQELALPVVTFLYHKEKDGVRESDSRVVIVTGHGFGTHPDHAGQLPSHYLVGVQLGVEGGDGRVTFDPPVLSGESVKAKSFSVDCIWGGSRGYNPVLASGKGETYERVRN